ncbi:hypothetical protein [Roseovarius indicus]|uniref:hypothetical protein n=1 Tax=Roseovarius indicus TaxID=540747 RepID=UPI001C2FE102|nr:hypothetical protein [Roseovarius indicus]
MPLSVFTTLIVGVITTPSKHGNTAKHTTPHTKDRNNVQDHHHRRPLRNRRSHRKRRHLRQLRHRHLQPHPPAASQTVTEEAAIDTAYYCEWVTVYDYYGNWVTLWQCY